MPAALLVSPAGLAENSRIPLPGLGPHNRLMCRLAKSLSFVMHPCWSVWVLAGWLGVLVHGAEVVTNTPPIGPSAGPAVPNIIFILADDLGYGDLGCYGQTRIKTPNLDRLAAGGMRFTQCYAGSCVSAPSRAALMTGLHSGHGWIRGDGEASLRPRDFTVAELLKQAGYKTGAIGKWALGPSGTPGTPEQKGFDQWAGFLDARHAQDYYPEFIWRCDSARGAAGKFPLVMNQGGQRRLYIQDLFSNAAANFIRLNKPDRFNQFTPFFLYLAVTLPHANNELTRRTRNGMDTPTDAPYSKENWPQPEKNKAAMITRLDSDVGRILDQLEQLKLATNTVVFFSSDNGPHAEGGNDPAFFASAGPFRGGKRSLHEGGLRVPLLVRWPGRIQAGVTNDHPCALWDFLPTAAELAGRTAPKDIDGRSLLPALLGKESSRHPYLYWEFHEGGFQQALRLGDWKAVRPAEALPLQLFDLKRDPGEQTDVAGSHPDVVGKVEKLLREARTESPLWPVKGKSE